MASGGRQPSESGSKSDAWRTAGVSRLVWRREMLRSTGLVGLTPHARQLAIWFRAGSRAAVLFGFSESLLVGDHYHTKPDVVEPACSGDEWDTTCRAEFDRRVLPAAAPRDARWTAQGADRV